MYKIIWNRYSQLHQNKITLMFFKSILKWNTNKIHCLQLLTLVDFPHRHIRHLFLINVLRWLQSVFWSQDRLNKINLNILFYIIKMKYCFNRYPHHLRMAGPIWLIFFILNVCYSLNKVLWKKNWKIYW